MRKYLKIYALKFTLPPESYSEDKGGWHEGQEGGTASDGVGMRKLGALNEGLNT